MKHSIVWSHQAEQDLDNIVKYIVFDNPITAKKIFLALKQTANDLCLMSERGRNIDELKAFNQQYCKFVMHKRWKIIYQIKPETGQVTILLVVDSSRDFQDVLFNTLSK